MAALQWDPIDSKAVDTARILAADAVEKVGNGHPGTAMSLAPAAYLLFQKVMRRDPSDSTWIGRDRFILSVGHSSLTQYTQFFLGGYGLEIEDLQALRTWDSKTPGHPEYGHTDGVEITTGPLGQGLASSVGFAYAARYERGLFDPETPAGESPFDHFVYVIAGDGDMQEGITSEASSLAGHQELGNLIAIYDSNQISIEDDTDIAFTEDVAARYEAYGWHVQHVDWKKTGEYVEDVQELFDAVEAAKAETRKPSLIILKTIIGWPSPKKQNSGKIHGSALGAEELAAVKQIVGFDPEKSFEVPDGVLEHTRQAVERGQQQHREWDEKLAAWAEANPERKTLLDRVLAGDAPEGLDEALPVFPAGKDVSTRAASGKVINAIAEVMPELWGGSADLAESNNTTIESAPSFVPAERSTDMWKGDPYGRVLHFGIREHAMGAILNGIVLHGNTRPFGGTFLIFSDYMRPAVRLAALMKAPSIFVWTHDSVALGGDGPTHQPVEQLASLRAIPGLDVIRPADANETAQAWKTILTRRMGPAGLALSRQNLPVLERGAGDATATEFASAAGVAKGAYILADTEGTPDVILIATGSEVQFAVEAREALAADGVQARVVSAPSLEWFEEQDAEYKEHVLPEAVAARVSVEAGISLSWKQYVGHHGRSISIEHFGASAEYEVLYREFGITTEAVVKAAKESIASL
ncbi:transketolase [Clavibacter michiganensis]|uniref:Transketolase n=1 Tax=Clavibacter michiganensis subsp. michiganensis (strain NCPPB 382) TaxID=443906 RepID=A5CRS7_CLAM3|nr:transketolase [Clavibacter michiganensis]MBE3076949.1 transketolase [Clavibacter michiganensis subsp. michiganensis]MBW8026755.1 transketolase [Clavibacter michiganensis subsp. michiganensis]MDO4017685.1 transketolase [Clavibacter michiganensis]MDO4031824.1 transketolase [Clavibacter michiganensis]MDO4036823.1 transketolase [Clavibacter michiganensis]